MAKGQRFWTGKERKVFDKMRAEGKTYRQIGEELNRTENSVIGFANRLRGYKTNHVPKPGGGQHAWSEDRLTEKWADRQR